MTAAAGRGGLARPAVLLVAALPVIVAALAGSLAVGPNLPWYHGLAAPAFAPPDWVFGPVWTLLYAAMIVAAYRVLCLPATAVRMVGLLLFAVQLVLNAGWCAVFFGAHNLPLGLGVILMLMAACIATTFLFALLDRWAGYCLLAVTLWVCFATVLNAAAIALNMAG